MYELYRLEHICKKSEQHQCPVTNINICAFSGQIQGFFVKDNYHLEMLYRIMTGDLSPDSGRFYINDRPVDNPSFSELKKLGVYAVGRQPQLANHLNVAENIVSVASGKYTSFYQNSDKIRQTCRDLFQKFDIHLNPACAVHELNVPQYHIVEILKGVYQQARIFIIDDIFFDYSSADFLRISGFLIKLSELGYTVLFFTRIWNHDFFSFTNCLNIIREGTNILKIDAKNFREYSSLLSFEDSSNQVDLIPDPGTSAPAMTFGRISTPHGLNKISFSVNFGEILGIYDSDCQIIELMNELLSGRTCCTGAIRIEKNEQRMYFQKYKNTEIGLITSRASQDYSYFPEMSILDNVTLMIPKKLCHPFGLFNRRIRLYMFRHIMSELHCDDILREDYRSAGNPSVYRDPYMQFKILIGRHICAGCRVLLIENPQGLYDSSNSAELIRLLKDVINQNIAVILISPNFNILNQTCTKIITTAGWLEEREDNSNAEASDC